MLTSLHLLLWQEQHNLVGFARLSGLSELQISSLHTSLSTSGFSSSDDPSLATGPTTLDLGPNP